MGNSPLVTHTKISPNKTSPRSHVIDTVTIHCYVGQVTVERGCNGFADPERDASANYIVGYDGRIGMCVEEKDRSWCTSNSDNDNRAITIEVASGTSHPYEVTDAAYKALINLLVDICQRNPGIGKLKWKADKSLIGQPDKQNMTVHRWFANKSCPGEWLYSRHAPIAAEVNTRLGANSTVEAGDGNYSKGVAVKLSANFKSTEFDCHGRGCCTETVIDDKLVEYLQKIRNHFKKPVTVSSAYRCPTHNKNVGSATGSYHVKGKAADIYINGVAPAEIAKYAESIGILGIGLYETSSDGHFVHVDTRTTKSFWYGQAQKHRSTFGGVVEDVKPEASDSKPENVTKTFKKGDLVSLIADAKYYNGTDIPRWVLKKNWYVKVDAAGDRVVLAKSEDGKNNINSPVHAKYLKLVKAKTETPYLAYVSIDNLNIRKGPGTNYDKSGVTGVGVFTIVEVQNGVGSNSGWGLLKSCQKNRNGWISLDYCKKV